MTKKEKSQKDYNFFISALRGMDIEELLSFYITARTGDERNIDKIPVDYLISLNEVGEIINKLYAEDLLNNVFKED